MRVAFAVVLLGVLGVLMARAVDPPQIPPAAEPVPAPDVTKDLRLEAVAKSGTTIDAGSLPWVELTLVNTSKTATHLVVKPGDGSELGWRDPYVHITAEQRGVDGKWATMPRLGGGRCGVFDSDWPKDVVELKPGEKLALGTALWDQQFNFQFPGRVRLTGHYAYRATGGKHGKPRPEAERGRMKGVPPFEIVSAPIEFDVVRPLDVKVRVKKPLKVGVSDKVSEVIEVSVTNTSDQPRVVGAPCGSGRYGLSWSFNDALSDSDTPPNSVKGTRLLKPGESVLLLGGGDFTNGVDGRWKPTQPGKFRVNVWYRVATESSPTAVVEGQATVEVVE